MRTRIAVFIAVFQMVMFTGHAFLYETWRFLWAPETPGMAALAWILGGVLALLGSLSLAEVAAMYPRAERI